MAAQPGQTLTKMNFSKLLNEGLLRWQWNAFPPALTTPPPPHPPRPTFLVFLLLFLNRKTHSWHWQTDCLEKFRLQFLPGDSLSHSLQLHTNVWPDFVTASWFPIWELPITSSKSRDAAWAHIVLFAPALIHKHFMAFFFFAYLYSLVMRTVQNTCLKLTWSLSLSAGTGWVLQEVLKDFSPALRYAQLTFLEWKVHGKMSGQFVKER